MPDKIKKAIDETAKAAPLHRIDIVELANVIGGCDGGDGGSYLDYGGGL